MGRAIVKVGQGEYVLWSSVVDAPVSWVGDREYIVKKVRENAADEAERQLDRAFETVDQRGHSAARNWGDSAEEFIEGNKAKGGSGKIAFRQEKQSEATLEEIRREYAMPESDDEFEEEDDDRPVPG